MPPRLVRALGSRWRLAGATALLLVAVMGTHAAVIKLFVKPTAGYGGQTILTFDLAGVSVLSGENYFPRFLDRGAPFGVGDLEKIYDPRDVTRLLWLPEKARGPGFVWTEKEYNVLRGHWVAAVVSQPRAYLTHRWRVFKALMSVGVRGYWPYWLPSWRVADQRPLANAHLTGWLYKVVDDRRTALPFRAWPYALGAVLLVMISLVPGAPVPRAFWAVAASVFAYEGAYLLVAPADNFRYSWWMVAGVPMLPAVMTVRTRLHWLREKAGRLRSWRPSLRRVDAELKAGGER
jgi:hypothetical protein